MCVYVSELEFSSMHHLPLCGYLANYKSASVDASRIRLKWGMVEVLSLLGGIQLNK